MEKQELLSLLNQTSNIEKLLTPLGGNFMPGLKSINRKPDFQIWKAELKRLLLRLKQDDLVLEILSILNVGFQNGYTDEKDFINLKGRLEVLSRHIDDYFDDEKEEKIVSQKLKKGTIVKTVFDEYTIIEQIGEGGNGRVFLATTVAENKVALKFIERNIGGDKLKRFKNEIAFCEHNKHKNIVEIQDRGYAFLNDKDYVFYVMPLYKETLKDKIKNGIPHEKVLDIFIGLLEGLKFAHEHKSIHRDIKPENIMFEQDSFEPIICDFGIAHFAEEDLLTMVETKVTDRMANFQYAAPEQRQRGGNVCFQTDIYALALILNEMFTREIPQAAGYKKIETVNSEYKYLDDLFDQLFKQKPEDRLYPEIQILSELRVLAERYKRDAEKERLKSVINEVVEPEEFNPTIVDLKFKGGALYFVFDTILPTDWFQMLAYGSYNRSCQMGYECNRLQKVDKNTILMPIRGDESKETITTLVSNVKSWVKTVSQKYSLNAKQQAIAEQRRKEEARIAEIKRIEKEEAMNSTINSVLKDLL